MLEKEKVVESITIRNGGTIDVLEVTYILEDGKRINGGRSNHRTSYEPEYTTDNVPAYLNKIAQVVWDKDTVDKWKAKKAEAEAIIES